MTCSVSNCVTLQPERDTEPFSMGNQNMVTKKSTEYLRIMIFIDSIQDEILLKRFRKARKNGRVSSELVSTLEDLSRNSTRACT